MRDQLLRRFERTNRLFVDLATELDASEVTSRLGALPSNTIGQQYWCVVGARTSYLAAAKAGQWSGFSCPLSAEDIAEPGPIVAALERSYADIRAYLEENDDPGAAAEDFLLDLLEHEAQHHGQLIRYIYGLAIATPQSWRDRYALD
jgi:hypothetical protein